MATLVANRQGDPVKIFQQQISDIENATEDKGPKGLRPWFRYVRAGQIRPDRRRAGQEQSRRRPLPARGDESFTIHNAAGEIVGRIAWFGHGGGKSGG